MRGDSIRSTAIALRAVKELGARDFTLAALNQLEAEISDASGVWCVSVGKAAPEMMSAVRVASSGKFRGGLVVCNRIAHDIRGVLTLVGDHPVPGNNSLTAGRRVASFLQHRRFSPDELVVFAVSGGASAMLVMPFPPVTIDDLHELTQSLVLSGLNVSLINEVRVSVSALHGGGILNMVKGGRPLGLILCDNVQVGSAAVGSGLTYPVRMPPSEAQSILASGAIPPVLRAKCEAAAERRLTAVTRVRSCKNITVASPADALAKCEQIARELGCEVRSFGAKVQGEARIVAEQLWQFSKPYASAAPLCVIGTGEVTVSVKGPGTGGRCQELAWAMARQIREHKYIDFTALATDGQDYLPGVMGAWVTGDTCQRALSQGFEWTDVIERNDCYKPLRTLGQIIPSHVTGTNLCDIYILCMNIQ